LQQSDESILSEFMSQLADAAASVLLLDYDGTLAPFHVDRLRAYPYAGVAQLLEGILKTGRSRVVIVSGRPVAELRPLLLPLHDIEIWGSHGLEHQLSDGTYQRITIASEIAASLQEAESWLRMTGLSPRLEIKPGGIAVHWRGVPAARIESVQAHVQKGLGPFAKRPGLKLLEFEGGLELRVTQPDKGDAVRSVLDNSSTSTPVAYLGDDRTDEDAFRALNSHGLSVLVRPEYRETNAQVWLRPPEELIGFLDRWLESSSA
jgi:trehalose 6-phosphate phosphatase